MTTTRRADTIAAQQACEGLFATDSKLNVQPGLITDYTYDEATKSYTFKLREGVPFHDGTIMTADDVVATLTRFRDSVSGANFRALADTITATDANTVTLTLKSASAAIPTMLATGGHGGAYIMPKSLMESTPADTPVDTLICTGPYKLESYVPDQEVVFTRFDDYASRDEEPNGNAGRKVAWVDTVRLVPNVPANLINSLRTGAVDIGEIPLDQVRALVNDPDLRVVVTPYARYPLLQLNTKAGPLATLKVRQAMLAGLDMAPIMLIYAGEEQFYALDGSLAAPGSTYYSTAGSELYNQANPAKAKELLAEAGYNGEEIRFMYGAEDPNKAPIIIQQMKDAGFNVKGMPVESAAFGTTRADPEKWDLFITSGTPKVDPSEIVFLNPQFPGWWDTPKKLDLMAQFIVVGDQEKRKAIWDEIQGLVFEEVPFIQLGTVSVTEVTTPRVQGYEPQFGMRGYYNIWVSQ